MSASPTDSSCDGGKPMIKERVAILVGRRGRGSNMVALVEACRRGEVPAEVVLVVAPSPDAPALERARELGLDAKAFECTDELLNLLVNANCEWICLAGYLNLLPSEVLRRYPERVLNIHPALLPEFGGQGMYGSRVHESVLKSARKESGCTVHYVTEEYDEGEVIFQARCEVLPKDTAETLAERILALEHLAYPKALAIAIERNRKSDPN